jgi:nucleoside-diphosphate-sugar epimerase
LADYLIAGCGYVGTALARRLIARGHAVHAIRRGDGPLPDGVRRLRLDMAEPFALPDLPALAGVVMAASAGGRTPEAYARAYVQAPANLLAALAAAGQAGARGIHVSSTGVFGAGDGGAVDEETPVRPEGFAAETLKAGEDLVRASGGDWRVLRLGGIYGPGRASLIEDVREGRARHDPEKPVWASLIHRDDAAAAIDHLLHAETPHALFLGVDAEPATRGAMIDWLAARLGVDPAGLRATGLPPPVRGNRRCSSRRLQESGFRFAFPSFREGYGALLDGSG